MPALHTEITVNMPRSKVWQTLYQKERWLYWNTFLYDCSPKQPFAQGQKVALSVRRIEGSEEIEFQPLVTLVQPNVCLKWLVQFPGFRHEQIFELQDIGYDRTRYIHQSNFSEWLCKLSFPLVRKDELRGLDRMARQLKRYTESLAAKKIG